MRASAAPRSVQRLVDEFSRLPGIGPKSASRLTYYLLRAADDQARVLADALSEMKDNTCFCSMCFNITESQVNPCSVCGDGERDPGIICVVEDPLDLLAIEKTGAFVGLYHVLQGSISPIDGVGPDDLKISELLERILTGQVKEVILATNPNLSGEATAMYLHQQMEPMGVHVTRLARGLPVGADLEYTDEITLARALEGRGQM